MTAVIMHTTMQHGYLHSQLRSSIFLSLFSLLSFILLHLLALNSSNNLPLMLTRSELQKPHSLPCSRVQFSIGDGYTDARTDECRFDVGGHVVESFI